MSIPLPKPPHSSQSIGKAKASSFLDRLNTAQREAVDFPFNRHCMVLAGAGCGKTTVLSCRVAQAAANYCEASRILAVTFTAKAAAEMRERVRMLLPDGSSLPAISTFHALGRRIVQVHRNDRQIKFLEDSDRLKLLAECCTIDDRRSLAVDLLGLCDLIDRRESESTKLDRHGAELLSEIAKVALGAMDYSDMMHEALAALQSDEALLAKVSGAFSYILVDEFQDSSPMQLQLLRLVLGSSFLFAVGDDDQSIYGFRGADPGVMTSFPSLFPSSGIIKLEQNYRSLGKILCVANRIFASKLKAFRKILHSDLPQGGRIVKTLRCEDSAEAVARMVAQIRELETRSGIEASACTILCRTNRSVKDFSETLLPHFDEDKCPQIMTIHSAKGLEFEAVFICDLEETIFPAFKASEKSRGRRASFLNDENDPTLAEEKRLFYVAVTRAKQFLSCVSIRKREIYGRIFVLKESRYLKYLD